MRNMFRHQVQHNGQPVHVCVSLVIIFPHMSHVLCVTHPAKPAEQPQLTNALRVHMVTT
jgi:hypothetical protein